MNDSVSKRKVILNGQVKPVSIKLKRLQWKEVMKKRFWKRCRLSRSCISRICRQLLNIEIKMKKDKPRRPLSVIEDNKSTKPICTTSNENVKRCKVIENLENPDEPPRKKVKQVDEKYPTSPKEVVKLAPLEKKEICSPPSDENDFTGFEESSSKIVRTSSFSSAGKGSPKNSISFMTKSGVQFIATKAISLPKLKRRSSEPFSNALSPPRKPTLTTPSISDKDRDSCLTTQPEKKPVVSSQPVKKSLSESDSNDSKVKECVTVRNIIENENCSSSQVVEENKNIPVLAKEEKCCRDVTEKRSILVCEELKSSPDVSEDEKDMPVLIREKESTPEVSEHEGRSCLDESESSRSSMESSKSSKSSLSSEVEVIETDKNSHQTLINGLQKDLPPLVILDEKVKNDKPQDVHNISDSDSETESCCTESVQSIHSERTVSRAETIVTESVPNSDAEESKVEENDVLDPGFDPAKFLRCDISMENIEDVEEEEEVPFVKSQNYQLNCKVRIRVAPLLLKDITNTFCFKNNLSGICGYNIRRQMQNMTFKAKMNQPVYQYTPETLPTVVHPQKGRESPPPEPVPFLDPFTHSLFGPIIKRDRAKSKSLYLIKKKFGNAATASLNVNHPQFPQRPGSTGPNSGPMMSKMLNQMKHRFNAPQPNSYHRFTDSIPAAIQSNNSPFYVSSNSRLATEGIECLTNGPVNSPVMSSRNDGPSVTGNIAVAASASQLAPGTKLLISQGNQYSYVMVPPTAPTSQFVNNVNLQKPYVYQQLQTNGAPIAMPQSNLSPGTPLYYYKGNLNNTVPVAQTGQINTSILPNVVQTTPTAQGEQVLGAGIVTSTPSYTTTNMPSQNSSICSQGPPPLRLGNAHLSVRLPTASNTQLQPPQLRKMGSSPPTQPSASVAAPRPTPLNPSTISQYRLTSQHSQELQGKEWDIFTRHTDFRHWLRAITVNVPPCLKCAFEECQFNTEQLVMRLRLFLGFGFPNKSASLLNAAYQMLVAELCCPHHVLAFIRKGGILRNIASDIPLSLNVREEYFPEPTLPSLSYDLQGGVNLIENELFILKRFVFAVDRESRNVLYPLPPFCIPKDSDGIDKITVVVLISPRIGLGPGMIVFPHSLLDRRLRLSLGDVGVLGNNWVVSAHQRGGLTQSMMMEFMNGEVLQWIYEVGYKQHAPYLGVDWWWCLDLNSLNSYYKCFGTIPMAQIYPSHRDPLDICISITLSKAWGVLVRSWRMAHFETLKEHHFPKFIFKTLTELCEPTRLQKWLRVSGLHPLDVRKAKYFMEQTTSFNF